MQVDIFNPFTSLEWKECKQLPVGMYNVQAVLLNDRVYVGGGETPNLKDDAKLYVYTFPGGDIWKTIDTPVRSYALAIYCSRLVVLVGGEEKIGLSTKKVWDLKETQCSWQSTLPDMNTEHCNATAVGVEKYLLVAGGLGCGIADLGDVEIFDGLSWSTAQSLPKPCYNIKSVVSNGNWYLIGGVGQDDQCYHATVNSLVRSSNTTDFPQSSSYTSVWNTLPNTPQTYSTPAILGNNLVTIGGNYKEIALPSKEVYTYSFHTNSWVHVDSSLTELCGCGVITLSENELLSIGGMDRNGATNQVSKGYVKGIIIIRI